MSFSAAKIESPFWVGLFLVSNVAKSPSEWPKGWIGRGWWDESGEVWRTKKGGPIRHKIAPKSLCELHFRDTIRIFTENLIQRIDEESFLLMFFTYDDLLV